jgi:uncharacterized protein
MEILPGFKIMNGAIRYNNTIILADVHIGYEEMLNKKGFLIPRLQLNDMLNRLDAIFNSFEGKKAERIIINGDLKHEFSSISEQEWRNTLKFIDYVSKNCNEVVLVKGNHDNILQPIARKRKIKIVDYFIMDFHEKQISDQEYSEKNTIKKPKLMKNVGEKILYKKNSKKTLVIHGDKIPGKEIIGQVSTIIIGHEHPAITLKEGARVEQFKCFLQGKYRGKNLIVLPSFNTIVKGTDILRDQILSPFLKQNLDNFEVYAVEDKAYNFGKVGKLRRKMHKF